MLKRRASDSWYTVLNRQGCQTCAIHEGTIPEFCDTTWNRHRSKTCATDK